MSEFSKSRLAGMNIQYMQYPLTYFLDSMLKYEIQNIELWGGFPHCHVDDLKLIDIKKIKNEIKSRDLSIICFTPEQSFTSPINLASNDNQARQRSIEYFLKCADVCEELESPLLLVSSGWGYENEAKEEAWKRSRESLELVASKTNVTLGLEPVTKLESNVVYDLETLKQMMDEVNSPKIKALIDTIPMVLSGDDFNSYSKVLGNDLVHIHFVDGDQKDGLGHVAWGEGNLPVESYFQQLIDNDYKGYLTLELISFDYLKNPNLSIETSLKTLAPYLNK